MTTSSHRTQALSHPIRLRILELFTRDPNRSLTTATLATVLVADLPGIEVRRVAYHLAVLKNAQLIRAR